MKNLAKDLTEAEAALAYASAALGAVMSLAPGFEPIQHIGGMVLGAAGVLGLCVKKALDALGSPSDRFTG